MMSDGGGFVLHIGCFKVSALAIQSLTVTRFSLME